MKKLLTTILVFAFSMLMVHAQSATSSSAKEELAKLKTTLEMLDEQLAQLESAVHLSWKGFVKPDFNGREYVDLGLPSGVLWATCNLGASKPEEVGDYYAWADTRTYTYENYVSREEEFDNTYGQKTGLYVVKLEDDAARVLCEGTWRLPSPEEGDELAALCTWEEVTINGQKGELGTSKINGNTIFFPIHRFKMAYNGTKDWWNTASVWVDAMNSDGGPLLVKPESGTDCMGVNIATCIRPVTSCSIPNVKP